MIVGLVAGRKGSTGYPNKNIINIEGKPTVWYSLNALSKSKSIEEIYITTDCDRIIEIGKEFNANIIHRPEVLCTSEAIMDDVLIHAYKEMKGDIDIIVLTLANSPSIPKGMIDKAVDILKRDESLDSVVSVCRYDMFNPIRANRLVNNIMEPYVDIDMSSIKRPSIRTSTDGCYFMDFSVQVLRSRCILNVRDGKNPFKWIGKKSYGLVKDYGFDIDSGWQIPVIKHWLKNHEY